ncbi:MAG: 23S rRNA (adenine(2503)-C(2))-methyltransferase RlmN [Firmicutes bacterium]|nr:23S rRNA (adenine(2503)-C(2))-methyltransferase RlmN [Bacillota bacterium]
MTVRKCDFLELTPAEAKGFMAQLGEPAYRSKQVLNWLWQNGAQTFAEMNNLPLSLRERLQVHATLGKLEMVTTEMSADGTEKILFSLPDGQTVETVILPYNIGDSVCISTQVGCRMGCLFCASGLPGFVRNLTSGEIMAQVLQVRRILRTRGRELKSMVLMGSGEPLDNWSSTVAFLEAVQDPLRLAMSLRHVTLSTSGLVPRIAALAELGWPVTLAVSLHAPTNLVRDRVMPINKKYPLEVLLPACDNYANKTGRRVTYEYILIENLNDDDQHASELATLLSGRLCHVNLIPYNAIAELPWKPSSQEKVRAFRDALSAKGINVTIRRRMGADIRAACGQLRNNHCRENEEMRGE